MNDTSDPNKSRAARVVQLVQATGYSAFFSHAYDDGYIATPVVAWGITAGGKVKALVVTGAELLPADSVQGFVAVAPTSVSDPDTDDWTLRTMAAATDVGPVELHVAAGGAR